MDQRVTSERNPETLPDADPVDRVGRGKASPVRRRSVLQRMAEHRRAIMAVAVCCVLGLAAIVAWRLTLSGSVSTDDAFIDARTVTVSPQVSAAVVEVPVTDNQHVKSGTLLVRLDNRDFQAKVDQAKAQVDAAQATIGNVNAQITAQHARIDQAQKQATQAEAALTFAEQQNQRYQQLLKTGTGTQEIAQQYHSGLLQAQATLAGAQANVTATQKQLTVLDAQLKQANAQLEQMRAGQEQAQVDLSRTVIDAPTDGYVTQLTAAVGNYAAAGQALMMFVPDNVWVTANFKETELYSVKPGDPVTITVDAYPGRKFQGKVASIQAGSGTAFSLLPSENATGNYVKIVQRVPVKIVFDKPPDVLLGPGMSVVPTVRTRR